MSNMAVCCGEYHTITLSNDGTVHSFGYNGKGQLGLGGGYVTLPTPIPNLPKINMVSCGGDFTFCVDDEGFLWSFGSNDSGQLGTGNTTNFNVPQKILDIPPVHSVSCGISHTLIITTDSNLWSCGNNGYGQLCLGNKENQSKPRQTPFSNISTTSGNFHSLFQNDQGEVFACGDNEYGQCGLGHFDSPQITPSRILNAPSNIVQLVCAPNQSFLLDSEGNVYSVGDNTEGSLGLNLNYGTKQNLLSKIPKIPPIRTISCVSESCYLIDFEGNLWTFGRNGYGQLGHNIKRSINAPKLIKSLKDIQQISYGCCGEHFFAKNSRNQIFAIGRNNCGQLGTGNIQSVSIFKEIKSQYSNIWRDEVHTRAKSARK